MVSKRFLVMGLLIHAAARPVRRSHIDTFLRPSLPRHTSYLYADWFRPALGSSKERLQLDQFVQGRPTPFFIVRSKTSDKLPKLNRVSMPGLQRIFCETPENPDFIRNDKMVMSVKIQNFSISQMTKRTSPLESSRKI